MFYVQRNGDGLVVAAFSNPQSGEDGVFVTDLEALPETHDEIVELRKRLEPKPSDHLREIRDEVSWLMEQSSPVAVEPVPASDLLHELNALRDLVAEQAAEIERLRAADAHNFPENMSDKLSDWDTVPDEASLTTADLTEEVIQRLTAAKRKKWTELLNVELAELQQERGGPREDLKREGVIEATLGLFSRVGEM